MRKREAKNRDERVEQMPLDAQKHRRDHGSGAAINGLEKAGAEEAVINHIAGHTHADAIGAVDLPAPVTGSKRVEVVRVLVLEERLSGAVTPLLF